MIWAICVKFLVGPVLRKGWTGEHQKSILVIKLLYYSQASSFIILPMSLKMKTEYIHVLFVYTPFPVSPQFLSLSTQTILTKECVTIPKTEPASVFHHLNKTLKPSITLHFSSVVITSYNLIIKTIMQHVSMKMCILRLVETFYHMKHSTVTKASHYQNQHFNIYNTSVHFAFI